MKERQNSELVNIGKIGSSVGLRGEVRVTLYAQDSDNLKEGKVLLLQHAGTSGAPETLALKCTGVRMQKNRPVIKLEGITDRNAADALRGMEVNIEADDLEELPEGEHYVRNIVGCTVYDIASDTEIGVLRDVIQNTAQSILDVESPEGKQILIPAVDAFIRKIDEENRRIEVELIPGFL